MRLCLHWVKAVYLCLVHPLLDRRSADKRDLVVNKAMALTELWTPAAEPTVLSPRVETRRSYSLPLATASAYISHHRPNLCTINRSD